MKAELKYSLKFNHRHNFIKTLIKQRELVLMSFPFIIFVLIMYYFPIWGWTSAFQDYSIAKPFYDQEWVGLKHFRELFLDENFWRVMRNTLAMSIINLVLGFVSSIGLALLLNELKASFFKRTVQTISYLPHFISAVICAGIIQNSLSPEGGVINEVFMAAGLIKEPVLWLGRGELFWLILGIANVWKEVGWSTIIYLSAMTSIDPTMYEAAEMDGAGRFRKMFNVTLPGIKNLIVILLIMNIGFILSSGFDLQYLLGNSTIQEYSENIDIFVLNYGINLGNYSFGTAAGIFKSVVSVLLIFLANSAAKKFGEERLI